MTGVGALPIFVVTLARPDLIERRPNWGAGKRNFASIYLEPLTEADMRELLAGLVPGLPPAAVAAIVARADGIPLYAVETVRSLLAEGRLEEKDGIYVPNGDLSSLTVPATLTALIASRLDALDGLDRQIIRDAAVLGHSFSVAALSAVGGMGAEDLEPRLDALVRRELLQRAMDLRSPEAGQYVFVQGLIREVAYNTLSKHDRKKLHLAAARYFESLGSEEIAGALATHYLAAHANAAEGAEADALASQARVALKAAAARAAALASFAQAGAFYEQALTVTTDPRERLDMLRRAADAAWVVGQFEEAERLFREALGLARQLDDRNDIARTLGSLGYVLIDSYRTPEARALLEPAIVELNDLDEEAFAELASILARARSADGDPQAALELLEPALQTAERRGFTRIAASAVFAKSNALFRLGRKRELTALTELARQMAAETGQTDLELRAIGNLAIRRSDLDWSAALETYADAIALARRNGRREQMLSAIANYGYAAFVGGEWDAGLGLLQPALTEELAVRDRVMLLNNDVIIRAGRGETVDDGIAEIASLAAGMSGSDATAVVADPTANAALAAGNLEKAHDEFLQIADNDISMAPEYLYRAAHPALWLRDHAAAVAVLARLEEVGGGGPTPDARLATVRAGIAALEGKTMEAMALYRDALRGWRDTNSVWEEVQTGLDMAELLDPGEPDVASVLASTRAILERLGAKPYLAQLDAAIARSGPEAAAKQSVAAASELGVAAANS